MEYGLRQHGLEILEHILHESVLADYGFIDTLRSILSCQRGLLAKVGALEQLAHDVIHVARRGESFPSDCMRALQSLGQLPIPACWSVPGEQSAPGIAARSGGPERD